MAKQELRLPDFGILSDIADAYGKYPSDTSVTIERSLLFFYTGQETTVGELNRYFTPEAITAFIADKYITIYNG